MSYESPIEIIYGEMKNQLENDVYSVIQSYGINVDKEELIKALQYDREQYRKGYEDAQAELKQEKGYWIDVTDRIGFPKYKCSVCQSKSGSIWMNYCPNCGADMR